MSAEPSGEADAAVDTLVERCLAGDHHTWETVVGRHRRQVFNVAYKAMHARTINTTTGVPITLDGDLLALRERKSSART
jgi:hypothetical protein